MSTPRARKEEVVKQLGAVFAAAEKEETLIITHYSGLNVMALTDLRIALAESGARLQVTKNALALRALEGLKAKDSLSPLLMGPTAIAWGKDPVALPKALAAFSEEHEEMKILGGMMEGAFLEAKDFLQLAKLPSLEALRGKIVGLLKAPAENLARQMNAPSSHFARLVQAYASKDA